MLKQSVIPVIFFLVLLFGGGFAWYYWYQETPPPYLSTEPLRENIAQHEPILPIPFRLPLNTKKVALGERLFHDPILSGDNTISCASCHSLTLGGTDRLTVSVGIQGQTGSFNAPTVFNSGFNFRQFWDGRAASLEEQIDSHILSPKEMGSDWGKILTALQQHAEYPKLFSLYSDHITIANIQDAIATFARSLYTPNARFDRFLRGDTQALSAEEQAGYLLFKNYGCISCHQGVNLGGNMYQSFGTMGDYFAQRGLPVNQTDWGRFNITGQEADKFVFKVPGLRNIALTAPYFHDGSVKTLEESVQIMGRYQLGRLLSAQDSAQISAFLRSLTGEYRGQAL